MSKKRKSDIIIIVGLIVLLGLAGLTSVIWRNYARIIDSKEYKNVTEEEIYDRHYVLIPEKNGSVIWEDIYRSAKQAAKEKNAYLELLGDWEAGAYTPLDYMKLATAAKVDGIILRPDGTAAMRAVIDRAEQEGIPVIAVLNDDSKSTRESFVGPNSYQLGTTYGREILKCIDNKTKKVMVLQRNDISGKELIFKELKSVVQQGLGTGRGIQIEDKTIISGNAFDVEEAIRDILYNAENRPDILVCMNATDSESAYHTMIDYNLVDEVNIIGYYQTDIQMEAISKNTMPSVITIDTEQVGNACIEALEEYHDSGYVSNYYSVELDVIDKNSVISYQTDNETSQEGA